MKIKSLYFKNFLVMILVLFLSFSVMGAAFAGLSYQFVIRDRIETMKTNAAAAGRLVSASAGQWDTGGLEMRAVLMWLSETTGFHFIVCDAEGTVISCSDSQAYCPHIGMKVPAQVISKINSDDGYYGITKFDGLYSEKRYAVGEKIPEPLHGRTFASYLIVSGAPTQMGYMWRGFAGIFLMVAVAVVMIALIMSFIATKKQTKPIKAIADAAYKFGRGDFSARVQESGRKDEIGELEYAFNRMAESMESAENARRDLIANVSHELKTPMTTITGFADGILDGTIPREKEQEYLTVISSETKRLSRLVRGMLDMSQLQSLESSEVTKKNFDLAETARQTLLSLEQKITDRGLDVDVEMPEDPVMTVGDKDAITQVIYNLLDNAAKFARPDSAIRIELWKEDGKAYFSVENEGETISKEELPLIFDRFHKTDHSRSMDRDGVGLGLYIVKTILDSHGQNVFVTSQDGVTKFTFTLDLLEK